jgi:RNA polymerase sigma factor (sigma-70 family)
MSYIGEFNRFIVSAKATARDSRERLAANNLALVPFLARKFCERRGAQVTWDILTVGIEAIYAAARKFDTGRGCKFSTCACRFIWNAYLSSTYERKREIRTVPFSALPYEDVVQALNISEEGAELETGVIRKLLAKMRPRDAQFVQEYYLGNQRPTYKEIGARHGVVKERVRQCILRGLREAREKTRRSTVSAIFNED